MKIPIENIRISVKYLSKYSATEFSMKSLWDHLFDSNVNIIFLEVLEDANHEKTLFSTGTQTSFFFFDPLRRRLEQTSTKNQSKNGARDIMHTKINIKGFCGIVVAC